MSETLEFVCSQCGAVHTIIIPIRAPELSTVAYAVLTASGVSRTEQDALKAWRNGKPISTSTLARVCGYSRRQTRRGLQELQRAGYVSPVPHPRGVQFAGVPTTMRMVSSLVA
jgi:hypothetical protein